jgi:alanine racemase
VTRDALSREEGPVPRDAQALLTLDLGALVENWRRCAARAAPAECAAVVKADAYGTGIAAAVPALAAAGCRTFFTAHVEEGTRARASLRAAGYADTLRIFILNGFLPQAAPIGFYGRFALSPVLGSVEQMRAFSAEAGAFPELFSALHVDTGMNRTGLDPEEAAALDPALVEAARCRLLMSHFAGAEEPENPVTSAQIAALEALRRAPALGELPASLCNSAGIFLDPVPGFDLVRPGYALYGGNPCPGRPNPMRPVAFLSARILQTRWIEAGEPVGYNGCWTARRRTHLGTIGLGYADGLLRSAHTIGEGGGPVARLAGVPCPLVGRVSMDLSLVDVTDVPEGEALPGRVLELLGAETTVDDLGAQCGTIGYEILTSLGRRYARTYIGG